MAYETVSAIFKHGHDDFSIACFDVLDEEIQKIKSRLA